MRRKSRYTPRPVMKKISTFLRPKNVTAAIFAIWAVWIVTSCSPTVNTDTRDRSEYFRQRHLSGQDTCPPKDANVLASPVHLAAAQGDLTALAAELAKNANVATALPNSGWTPLICAAGSGNLDVVQALLTKHVDVNKVDATGKSPLVLAAQRGYSEILKALLAAGADPNTPWENRYALSLAASLEDAAIRNAAADALLSSPAIEIDRSVFPHSSTALSNAATAGDAGLVEKLLARGAHPARVDLRKVRDPRTLKALREKKLPTSSILHTNPYTRYELSEGQAEALFAEEANLRFTAKHIWTEIAPESKLSRAWKEYFAARTQSVASTASDPKIVEDTCDRLKKEVIAAQSGDKDASPPLTFSLSEKIADICATKVEPDLLQGVVGPVETNLVSLVIAKSGTELVKSFIEALEVAGRLEPTAGTQLLNRLDRWLTVRSGWIELAENFSREAEKGTNVSTPAGINLRADHARIAMIREYFETAVQSLASPLDQIASNELQKRGDASRAKLRDLDLVVLIVDRATAKDPIPAALLQRALKSRTTHVFEVIDRPYPDAISLIEAIEAKLSEVDLTQPPEKAALHAFAKLLAEEKSLTRILTENEGQEAGTIAPTVAEAVARTLLDLDTSVPSPAGPWLVAATAPAIETALTSKKEKEKVKTGNGSHK